ncbi:hypothetical protein SAMN02745146_1010 [Hymenobacter daecheongensis DSM 21074]|uniref:DUF5683 domain-containing protein n=1 Tax=Hymenobacter daecheongensis DSM 21074 TaxID=1121955 RepID=A0A1M6C332_9BACT|nr:DUF5683 domain-containing protein [Hymenobacter daecheongensis]SHI55420.1 hypothetical protein SAMN02745146_1010 [Hymenobacter daecheongensis DSM 21074]
MIGLRTATAALVLPATLALAPAAHAQAALTAGPDSARVSTPAVPDSSRRTEKLFGLRMTRPAKAGLLSALLPGTGQIYNRRYWKLPLVYGAIGGTIYGEIHYQRLYKEYKTAYEGFLSRPRVLPSGPNKDIIPDSAVAYRGVVAYRTPRDQYYFYIGVAYALNILDAVVDAHLRDFDISDDLSLHWEPTLLRMPTALPTPGVMLTLNLNSRRAARPTTTL